jgi:putative transposase
MIPTMFRAVTIGLWILVRATLANRAALAIENLALRQQLAVLERERFKPRIRRRDRAFWILLRRLWSNWSSCLVIVEPDTVVAWHRRGFRWVWRWRSRTRHVRRPRVAKEIRELILRMAAENRWGAPRIHGELLKPGVIIDERTVSRYLPKRPSSDDRIRQWKAFLRNHRDALAGIDFFEVPTAAFGLLWVFFVIRHDRRRILHFGISESPDASWIVQNLREAFPFNASPKFVVMDRDSKYGTAVPDALRNMGAEPVRCGYRSPWQNGAAERWVGTVRRELLDHVVVFNTA